MPPIDGQLALDSARILVGTVLLFAGATKIRDVRDFGFGVANYGILPPGLSVVAGRLIPPLEILLAGLLMVGVATRAAAVGAAVLLSIFLFAVAVNVVRGRAIPCYCFGRSSDDRIGVGTVLRLLVLALLAGAVATWAPDRRGLVDPPALLAASAAALALQTYLLASGTPLAARGLLLRPASPNVHVAAARIAEIPDLQLRG